MLYFCHVPYTLWSFPQPPDPSLRHHLLKSWGFFIAHSRILGYFQNVFAYCSVCWLFLNNVTPTPNDVFWTFFFNEEKILKPLLNSFRVLAELQPYIMRAPVWSVLGGTYCWRRKVPAPSNNPSEPNDEARDTLGDTRGYWSYFSGDKKQT